MPRNDAGLDEGQNAAFSNILIDRKRGGLMNRTYSAIFMAVGLMIMAAAADAHAQISQQYNVKIPFDFSLRGSSYAAGEYKIRPASSDTTSAAIQMTDVKTGRTTILGLHLSPAGDIFDPDRAKLVFVKAGFTYRLLSIDTPTIRMNFKTRMEEIDVAANAKSEVVYVFVGR